MKEEKNTKEREKRDRKTNKWELKRDRESKLENRDG